MPFAVGWPGEVARLCDIPEADLEQALRPGEVMILVDDLLPGSLSADGLSFVPYVPGLADRKAERWEEAKRVRRKRMTGGIDVPGVGRIDTRDDPMKPSQQKIEQAAGEAIRAFVRGLPFAKVWTLADDSPATLDAEQMMAIGDAVVAHVQACQDAGTAIRALIDAAEDEAALADIDITAGYPALP